MRELWKTTSISKRHEISNLGRVRMIRKGAAPIYRKISIGAKGKLRVQIDSDQCQVARLVGEAFCKSFKPELRPVYRDGNSLNCCASNLKWVSQSQVTGAPYSRNPKV